MGDCRLGRVVLSLTPWSAITRAPASTEDLCAESWPIVAVSPRLVQLLLDTKMPRGETVAHASSTSLLPSPGSPTSRTCASLRRPAYSLGVQLNRPSSTAALTISWPTIFGHSECTSNLSGFPSRRIRSTIAKSPAE